MWGCEVTSDHTEEAWKGPALNSQGRTVRRQSAEATSLAHSVLGHQPNPDLIHLIRVQMHNQQIFYHPPKGRQKESFTILKQVYRTIAHTVQGAFKDLMTHRFMQIALLFAFHCVLHRCKSQEIHC